MNGDIIKEKKYLIKFPLWFQSVRSIMSFEVITTYCLVVIGMIILAIIKIIDVQVFLAFLSGFTGTVGTITTFYYLGKKRIEENGKEQVK